MIKRLINKTLRSERGARLFHTRVLKLHTYLYKIISKQASHLNGGIHPKHQILKYKEWFLDNISANSIVLDVGCNTGMMAKVFSSKADFVYGIEIRSDLIKRAEANNANEKIEFICGDATTHNYDHCRPIDCVTLSNVLEHIDKRVDFLIKLKDQIKWSNPNEKKFILRVPMINRDWIAVYKKELGLEWKLDGTHFTEYTEEQFRQEIGDAGLDIISLDIRFGEIYSVCKSS